MTYDPAISLQCILQKTHSSAQVNVSKNGHCSSFAKGKSGNNLNDLQEVHTFFCFCIVFNISFSL